MADRRGVTEHETLALLSGTKAHLCPEWDGLAIDETCLCYEESS